MPNYANGKIYTVRSVSRPDLIYVGSTTQTLSKRHSEHKIELARGTCISRLVIEIGDSYIELHENFPCSSREELRKREGEVQRSIPCVNRVIAGRTKTEYRAENRETILAKKREYVKQNKESIRAKKKLYNEAHKEQLAVYHKQYREAHAEELRDAAALRYAQNKSEINAKGSIRVDCECGGFFTKSNRSFHYKSARHQNRMFSIQLYEFIYS